MDAWINLRFWAIYLVSMLCMGVYIYNSDGFVWRFLFLGLTCAYVYFSYEDFFGSNKKKASKRKSKVNDRSEDLDMGDEQEDSDMGDGQEDSGMGDEQEDSDMGDEQEDDGAFENKVFFFFKIYVHVV